MPRSTSAGGARRTPAKPLTSKTIASDWRPASAAGSPAAGATTHPRSEHDEHWLEDFLLSLPGQVVIRHDGDGRIVWISPGSEVVFGRHRSALLATDSNEHIH